MYKLARIIPSSLRRNLEVFLVDHGFPPQRRRGAAGIAQLGHRGYVGRESFYDEDGHRQFDFLVGQGLRHFDVLCDIGCGSLRGGRRFIEYLDAGNYLGLDGEGELVQLGIEHELDPSVLDSKVPEFVVSYEFEFGQFSRSPTYALAVSVFSHLIESDIRLCLQNLADRVTGPCQFFASYFETDRPKPNFRRSHPQIAFYYTRQQMERFGQEAGWAPEQIGEWGSPSGQLMMKFVRLMEGDGILRSGSVGGVHTSG